MLTRGMCRNSLFNVLFLAFMMTVRSAPLTQQSTKVLVNEISRRLSRVELTESPRVHMSKVGPSHVTVREGESLTLECSAVGVPAPIIYWKKDGHRIRQAHGDNESNLFEKITNIGSTTVETSSSVGRLHLDCVQPSMAGTYECVADNSFTKLTNQTRLTVLPRGEPISAIESVEDVSNCQRNDGENVAPRIYLFTEWRFEKQGNNVQLFCRASGSPRPRIIWLDENLIQVQSGENISVLSNGDLFLRNVQSMGQFYCVASNVAGEAKMDSFLYVTKPDENNDTEIDDES